jgi:hypothetical protein
MDAVGIHRPRDWAIGEPPRRLQKGGHGGVTVVHMAVEGIGHCRNTGTFGRYRAKEPAFELKSSSVTTAGSSLTESTIVGYHRFDKEDLLVTIHELLPSFVKVLERLSGRAQPFPAQRSSCRALNSARPIFYCLHLSDQFFPRDTSH